MIRVLFRRRALVVPTVLVGAGLAVSGLGDSLGGPIAAQGAKPAAASSSARPDDTRFTAVTLVPMGELDEPMTFAVAGDGRVFINERRTGHIKVYNPRGATTTTVGTIPINHTYISAGGATREAEEGFHGIALDPNFETNRWMYLHYADPDVAKHVVARITLRDETTATGEPVTRIVPNSHVTMIEWPAQRETCCHTGGGMTFDAQGNLYITNGNNTGNTGTSQTDERPGRANWDDQRGASNTNSLTGKILRIRPQPDGGYTIPAGNLFPPGTPGTRPEIYTMGHRNVWRVSVDSATGYIYWGEVGPDNQADNPEIGPRGYDELNQARRPGFFGWPYFVGPNAAFPYRDYVTGRSLAAKDPAKPTNTSVNNTGLTVLPPAQPAFIGYEYGVSERFPEFGAGGRCAVGGPVFRRADFAATAPRVWPAYFEGKWLATDCSRAWIMSIAMDASGDYVSAERLLPNLRFSEPMDMKFGPDGDLYVLDYGSTWFAKSEDARLVRIEYNSGNRAPLAVAASNKAGGTVPFQAVLSSAGSRDYDGDPVEYEWTVSMAGGGTRTFRQPNPTVTFDRAGVYTATLRVSDSHKAASRAAVEIVAGNEPPAIDLTVTGTMNRTFFTPGAPFTYAVRATDREDGVVPADQVVVTIDYVPEGFDVDLIRQGQERVDSTSKFAVAKAGVARSDCAVCHSITGATSLGPSLSQLRERYKPDQATLNQLAAKVRNGGTGVWGTNSMPSHPLMPLVEARAIVDYFLRSGETTLTSEPLSGTFTPNPQAGDNGRGSVIVRAVYTDKGAGRLPARTSEAITVLRSPSMGAVAADVRSGVEALGGRGNTDGVVAKPNGHLGFRGVDLTGIRRASIGAQTGGRGGEVGGTIEIRLGSPTGELIGQVMVGGAPAAGAGRAGGGAGAGGAQAQQEAGGAATAGAGRGVIAPPPAAAAGGGGRGGGGGSVAAASAQGFPVSDRNTAPAMTAGALAGRGGAGGGAAAAGPAAPAGGAAGAANTGAGAGAGRGGGGGGGGGGRGGAAAAAATPGLSVDLKPVTGVHDVYLVFKNDRVPVSQRLATVTQVTFAQ